MQNIETFYYPLMLHDGSYTATSIASGYESHGSFTTGRAAQAYADKLNASHPDFLALSVAGRARAKRLTSN